MNLDKTFCTGMRCGKASTCERWIQKISEWAKESGRDLTGKRISVAEFADHKGNCTMYEPDETTEILERIEWAKKNRDMLPKVGK